MSHSPLISSAVELYNGLTTFRLYGAVDFPRSRYRAAASQNVSTLFHARYCVRFMFIINGLFSNVFILVTFVLICSSKLYQWSFIQQDINYISVTLNWVMIIPNFLDLLTFFVTLFVSSMSSAERMILNVDQDTFEGPLRSAEPPAFDPAKGIRIRNVYSKYRTNLPFVLKGLSLDIANHQKVALVGRTGSGKSSLLLALARILNVRNSRFYARVKRHQSIGPDPLEYARPSLTQAATTSSPGTSASTACRQTRSGCTTCEAKWG